MLQQDSDPLAGLPLQASAVRQHVCVFSGAEVSRRPTVLVERIVRFAVSREAQGEGLSDRNVDHSAEQVLGVITELNRRLRGELLPLRLRCNDVKRPCGGVSAAQGALRTTVHLYALQVVQHRADATRTWDVDAVDMGCGCGVTELGVVVRPDAADVNLSVTVLRTDVDVGGSTRQFTNRGYASAVKICLTDGACRTRVVLHVLFTAVHRDAHDFLFLRRYRTFVERHVTGRGLHVCRFSWRGSCWRLGTSGIQGRGRRSCCRCGRLYSRGRRIQRRQVTAWLHRGCLCRGGLCRLCGSGGRLRTWLLQWCGLSWGSLCRHCWCGLGWTSLRRRCCGRVRKRRQFSSLCRFSRGLGGPRSKSHLLLSCALGLGGVRSWGRICRLRRYSIKQDN